MTILVLRCSMISVRQLDRWQPMLRCTVGSGRRGGDGARKSPHAAGFPAKPAYLDALRVDFFSAPWLLRLLEALAWLGADLDSVLAAVRPDAPLERLSELLDCFVAMWNSLNALGLGFITTSTRKAEDVIEGSPVLIARDGKLLTDELRKHRLGQGEWEQSLREADAEMHEVRRAFLESDGTISILKTKAAKQG